MRLSHNLFLFIDKNNFDVVLCNKIFVVQLSITFNAIKRDNGSNATWL